VFPPRSAAAPEERGHASWESERQTENDNARDRDRDRDRERQRDRDREAERQRQRDRETERQRDRETETERRSAAAPEVRGPVDEGQVVRKRKVCAQFPDLGFEARTVRRLRVCCGYRGGLVFKAHRLLNHSA